MLYASSCTISDLYNYIFVYYIYIYAMCVSENIFKNQSLLIILENIYLSI